MPVATSKEVPLHPLDPEMKAVDNSLVLKRGKKKVQFVVLITNAVGLMVKAAKSRVEEKRPQGEKTCASVIYTSLKRSQIA